MHLPVSYFAIEEHDENNKRLARSVNLDENVLLLTKKVF